MTPDNKGKVSNDKIYQPTSSSSKKVYAILLFLLSVKNLLYKCFYFYKAEKTEDDPFFDLLSRFQAGRMDDQRCTLGSSRNLEDKENQNSNKLIHQISKYFICY